MKLRLQVYDEALKVLENNKGIEKIQDRGGEQASAKC